MTKQIKVNDIFFQEAQPECEIPAHWCVQYFKSRSHTFPNYEYFYSYEEAKAWAKENEG